MGDIEKGAPRTAENRFRIGSVTKPAISALVLRLVARNALDLVDTSIPFALCGELSDLW